MFMSDENYNARLCDDCLHKPVCVYLLVKGTANKCDFKQTREQITKKVKKNNLNWRRKCQRLRAKNRKLQAKINEVVS